MPLTIYPLVMDIGTIDPLMIAMWVLVAVFVTGGLWMDHRFKTWHRIVIGLVVALVAWIGIMASFGVVPL